MNRVIASLLALNFVATGTLLWRTWTPSTHREPSQAVAWPEIEPDSIVSYTYKAELVRVIDGDTIVLDIDLGFETWLRNQVIRLYGIDTPEMKGKEKPEGLKVTAWMEQRLEGREIVLQSIQDKKGNFGRWLGIVFADGENVNEELLAQGMANKFN